MCLFAEAFTHYITKTRPHTLGSNCSSCSSICRFCVRKKGKQIKSSVFGHTQFL